MCMCRQAHKAGEAGEPQLQLQAFEAVNEMVRSAPTDSLLTVQQLIPAILQRLQATLPPLGHSQGSSAGPDRQSDLQVDLQLHCSPCFQPVLNLCSSVAC